MKMPFFLKGPTTVSDGQSKNQKPAPASEREASAFKVDKAARRRLLQSIANAATVSAEVTYIRDLPLPEEQAGDGIPVLTQKVVTCDLVLPVITVMRLTMDLDVWGPGMMFKINRSHFAFMQAMKVIV